MLRYDAGLVLVFFLVSTLPLKYLVRPRQRPWRGTVLLGLS